MEIAEDAMEEGVITVIMVIIGTFIIHGVLITHARLMLLENVEEITIMNLVMIPVILTV
tara:strand:- start:613 stop:789 length:177 start_codon:yes stop_codon:yes gene_type:complete